MLAHRPSINHEREVNVMSKARARIPEGLNLLGREWQEVIKETPLNRQDRFIATQYLVNGMAQVDIAAEMRNELGYEVHRNTVGRRLPGIIGKVEQSAKRMGLM